MTHIDRPSKIRGPANKSRDGMITAAYPFLALAIAVSLYGLGGSPQSTPIGFELAALLS